MSGGYCTHPEKMVLPYKKLKKRIFPALFSLIEHPVHGPILFDTGYSSRFFSETKRFPYRLFRLITPVTFSEHESARSQVKEAGYAPEEIRTIILSHLHTDHVAGLMDFPRSEMICSRSAWEAVRGKEGWSALKRGLIPSLLPGDFADRVLFVEDTPVLSIKDRFSPFETGRDLFGDGSLISVALPGHAAGQIGLFLRTEQQGTIFLAADSCWVSEAYQKNVLPHPLTDLLTADKKALVESLAKVHALSLQHPDITIVPSHCLETWKTLSAPGAR
ncbi:MBL fold metallo-hydrolase [Paenactinomyces guangxiensis]|uniref:MBL fold metallo-hydrolase n=2 Tax=Paenactinomyces guangxiensis TaxID=1490290 RepID=A0A7W2A7R6_9BACL|nr:MBL fold metallo-hydrolase [Paenactinomyces guangxiensis]